MSNEAKWRIEYSKYSTYCNIIDADGYVGTIQGREKAELIAKAPEMAAEIERLKDRINTYLDAVHSIAHKRIDLQDVVDAIRGVSNQTEEIDRQAAELSKLRQENERYKEALQCMMNVEHHGDFMNAFFDLKDQVKAALQGE